MTSFDAFRYDGKRAVVVGGATGMGAAAAELLQDAGAEVVVMDFAEVTLPGATAIHVNLADATRSTQPSTECGGPVHALLLVRRGGRRHARHREDQLHRPPPHDRPAARPSGCCAVAVGHRLHLLGRRARLGGQPPRLKEYLATPDFDAAVAWIAGQRRGRLHVDQAGHLRLRGQPGLPPAQARHPHQRHLPGPTDTPLAQANKEMWLGFGADYRPRWASRRPPRSSRPIRWCSCAATAAAAINGITLVTDAGYFAAGVTEAFPPATDVAMFLLGRLG